MAILTPKANDLKFFLKFLRLNYKT